MYAGESTRPHRPLRRALLCLSVLAGMATPAGEAGARVNPLTLIEHQIQKPNMLIVFDTSGSMNLLPNAPDMDIHEAGMDCDEGDAYCRTVGKKGRCYMTMSGKNGPGRENDTTLCTQNSDCTKAALCRHNDDGILCTSNSQCDDNTCGWVPNNYCVLDDVSVKKIQMCRLGLNMCRNQTDCNAIPGDSCGPATSRLLIAKRVLKQVVQEFHQSVNFGMMTFKQQGYYPYFEVSGSVSYETRPVFLSRAELEFGSCFTPTAGPSASCTIAGTVYTLKATENSRYEVNKGTTSELRNASWGAGCGEVCDIAGVGTGIYEGSHYTFQFAKATPGIPQDLRRLRRAHPGQQRQDVHLHGRPRQQAEPEQHLRQRAQRHHGLRPQLHQRRPLGRRPRRLHGHLPGPAGGQRREHGPTDLGHGGQGVAWGHLPLRRHPLRRHAQGDGHGRRQGAERLPLHPARQIAEHANGVSCRKNSILFITDGMPNGTGDADCDHNDCALSPPGPSCTCAAVLNAHSIRTTLDTKVYVVGFSGTLSSVRDIKAINNIAKAGGTKAGYYAIKDSDLYEALTAAIYDSVSGSYATSPVTVGGPSKQADGSVATTTVLDSRVDFPSWKGHLISYDVSDGTPVIKWDAARWFSPDDTEAPYAEVTPDFWKSRNVFTSSGKQMVKVEVDASGVITNAAQLRDLGLGVTSEEAALVARWMLGDPALGNPAVLGAFVNSTPIEVGGPLEPTLTYVGSSDGMLHAFHSRTQKVGSGPEYKGGQEAST